MRSPKLLDTTETPPVSTGSTDQLLSASASSSPRYSAPQSIAVIEDRLRVLQEKSHRDPLLVIGSARFWR